MTGRSGACAISAHDTYCFYSRTCVQEHFFVMSCIVLSYVAVVHAVVAAALFSMLNGVVQQPRHLDL
eukprot:8429-Heterococcus_DN1.PRE.1